VAVKWLSPGTMIYPTNETDRHDIISMYIIVTYNKAIAQMTFTIVNIPSYISRRHEGKLCAA
jgi:hypothetical protein